MMTNQKINLNLFTPYPAQRKIVKACIDSNHKFVIINASRQSGKTFLAENMAIYYALSQVDQNIMIVSPVDSQAKKIYKQILNLVINLPFIKSNKIQSGDSEICFKNGSTILFRSAASKDSLRGNTLTHLIIDEAAFIEEEVWTTILAPMLLVRGKKAIFCSTPRGKNFFYKLFMEGKKDGTYISFKNTYKDNPFADLDFIEGQKKLLPVDVFSQEYMAEFIDGGALFKNVETTATSKLLNAPLPSNQYYMGVDIGFKNDSTVIIILNQNGHMVFMDRFNNTTNQEIINRIKSAANKFKVAKCLIESNSFGLPIVEQVIQQGVWIAEGFATTSSSKPLIINDLIYAFNGGEFIPLDNKDVIEEFSAFGYTISKKGAISYAATYGHDDIVMASAIAYYCLKNNKYAGQFIFS